MTKNKICCIYVKQEYFNTFIHEVACTVNLIESKCSTTVSYVQQMTYIICIGLLFSSHYSLAENVLFTFLRKNFEKRQSSYRYLSFEKKKNALIFVRISRISLILEYLNHKNYKIKREYTRRKRWKKEKKKKTQKSKIDNQNLCKLSFFAHNIYPLFPYTLAQTFGSYEETEKKICSLFIFLSFKICISVSKKQYCKILQNKEEEKRKNSHLNIKIYRCFMSNRL